MKSLIEQLRAINTLDEQLKTIRKDLERIPRELAARAEGLRLQADTHERRTAEIARLKTEVDAQEGELKTGEEALKRYASKMNTMRISKEFDTLRRQMDAQRVWNKQSEDKILEALEKINQKQAEADALSAKVQAEQQALETERADREKELAELRAKQDALLAERNLLVPGVPPKELKVYEAIAVNRHPAVAHVASPGMCMECRIKIPPQQYNMVLQQQELMTCPSCGRILTPLEDE